MTQAPTQQELLGYFETLSNWGRWGAEDRKGTLNLITDAKRREAAQLVRDGESVSCSRVIPGGSWPGAPAVRRSMVQSGEGYALQPHSDVVPRPFQFSAEHLSFVFHGVLMTHIDSLSHLFWEGRAYNGISAATVTAMGGATVENIEVAAADGILSRGVLLDVARLHGKPYLTAAEPVLPEDLEAAERAQGVRVGEGDILLLRTGYPSRFPRMPVDGVLRTAEGNSGYHAACLPWLRERGVALIGCDTANDVTGAGEHYPETTLPIHQVALVAMGLRLIDNADLERLGETCARKGRYDFMLALNPLRLEHGTGSPANPIATF